MESSRERAERTTDSNNSLSGGESPQLEGLQLGLRSRPPRQERPRVVRPHRLRSHARRTTNYGQSPSHSPGGCRSATAQWLAGSDSGSQDASTRPSKRHARISLKRTAEGVPPRYRPLKQTAWLILARREITTRLSLSRGWLAGKQLSVPARRRCHMLLRFRVSAGSYVRCRQMWELAISELGKTSVTTTLQRTRRCRCHMPRATTPGNIRSCVCCKVIRAAAAARYLGPRPPAVQHAGE